jgi:hypothetical protein
MRPRPRTKLIRIAILTGLAAFLFQPLAAEAKKPGKLVTKSKSVNAPDDANTTVKVSCKKGSNIVGGGFKAEPANASGANYVFESRRVSKRAWQVSGTNISGVTGNLTAIAYCQKNAPKLAQAATTISIPSPPPQSTRTASAPCPPGKRPAAGGFLGEEGGDTAALSAAFPYSSRRLGASWIVSAMNTTGILGAGEARSITAYAYCGKTNRPQRLGSASVGGVETPKDVYSGKCPKNQKGKQLKALSGGFDLSPPPFIAPFNATNTRIAAIRASVRAKTKWRTSVTALGDLASTVTSFGYCG